ncbi:MAG: hypothetical protein WCJ33_00345 [Pseudomonadota bacterium]
MTNIAKKHFAIREFIAKLIKCGEAASFSLREKVRMRGNNYKNQGIDFLQNPSPRPSPRGRGSFVIFSLFFLSFLITITDSFAVSLTPSILCPYQDKTREDLKKTECPSYDNTSQNTANTTGCNQSSLGEISLHVANGTLFPCGPLWTGTQPIDPDVLNLDTWSHTDGILPTDGYARKNSQPSVPSAKPPSNVNSTLEHPSVVCIPSDPSTAGSIPALPCGGAIPIDNRYINLSDSVTAANVLNIGGNIKVSIPFPPLIPDGSTVPTIVNKIAKITPENRNCEPSIYNKLPTTTPSVVFQPTTISTTVTPSINYSTGDFKADNTVKFDFTKYGMIQFPNGAEFLNPQKTSMIILNKGDFIISFGDEAGTIIIPKPKDTTIIDAALDTKPIPQDFVGLASQFSALLPTGSVWGGASTSYSSEEPYTPPSINGYYLIYSKAASPLVIKTNAITNYKFDLVEKTIEKISSDGNIPAGTIKSTEGAVLEIPLGGDVKLGTKVGGEINLPSGGNITVAAGGTINGVAVTADTVFRIPQGQILTADGTGNVKFTNGTTLTFPSSVSLASIVTTAIGLPPQTIIPIGSGAIAMPQLPASPKIAAASCP